MPNMRVDVIYNQSPADFELEFNLGACCQMRLFKTVTTGTKDYINALAKAVTRSKIIIVCGSIYGDEGLIRITAKATHKKTVVIDTAEYGIAQDMNVEIIDGSVPLVSSSGIFGGIIIESGPQTIIILTENRDVRKDIMQNLVHQYIKEVSILEIRQNSGSAVLTKPAESSNEDSETEKAETTPENTENSAFEGEVVDFSEEDRQEEQDEYTAFAPSDEALKAVAEELNDLSSTIGETLYANDKSNKTEEEKETPDNDAESSQTESSLDDNNIETEIDFEPQIDFTIDDDNTAGEAETAGEAVDDNSSDTINLNEYLKDTADINFVGDEPYFVSEQEEKKNKSINKAIIIIAVLLIVMLLLLGYFLVYTPLKDGINPGDYITSLFSAKIKINRLFWRF